MVKQKKYRDLCDIRTSSISYNSANQNQKCYIFSCQNKESYDTTTSQNQDFSEEKRRKESKKGITGVQNKRVY